ncbi:MAG: aromatic aminobenezylarsenical efflux permease ArsG family transporter [Planctomycetia bacterium]|nr:aromatic aminobenezylarsenical efflux permease ArsG family transporter [Planctomycetia bacterium]
MTMELLLWLGAVIFSGILTSISPCPLATNIAAVSLLARQAGRQRSVLTAGFLYATGRMVAYTGLAILLLNSTFLTGETLLRFLAVNVHEWLGPFLVLLGMLFSGMISFSFGHYSPQRVRKIMEKLGIWSAFPLGVLFALAFCPTSTAAFLTMLGIAGKAHSLLLFPAVFGLATSLPVLIFSWILAFQPFQLDRTFERTRLLDVWVRSAVAVVFLFCGIYFSVLYVWL